MSPQTIYQALYVQGRGQLRGLKLAELLFGVKPLKAATAHVPGSFG